MDNVKFNWGNSQKHKMLLILFMAYNIVYAVYMLGYLGRNLYLVSLFAYMGIMAFVYMKEKDFYVLRSGDLFISEYKSAMFIVLVISLISIFLQIWHKDYCTYFVNNMLYLIIPPTMAFLWINTTDRNERYSYFVVQMFRNIFYFIWANHGDLTLNNILNIRWEDSKSSVFETVYAHDFFFLEIIFLYMGKTRVGIICMLLCMLNFKRLSFILSVVYFVAWIIIKQRKNIYDKVVENKNINTAVLCLTGIILCVMPMAELTLISEKWQELFFNKFGITLNQFTTGRSGLIQNAMNNMEYFNGFGSTTEYMKTHADYTMRHLGSIHCDWVSLYLETTILGVVAYTVSTLKIFRKNLIVFFLMIYMYLSLITTHFFDQLRIWILLYMFAAYLYCKDENGE